MAVSLVKGGNISLDKASPGLKSILIGLGWDVNETQGAEFDLDASAFLLNAGGKVRNGKDFIFYNNLKSPDGSVEHTGDNRTGAGEGDDEVIFIELDKIPADVQSVVISCTIHEAENRRQNFGMVSNAFIRIVNRIGDAEIARYDLTDDMGDETAMIFGEIYRESNEWKFRAVGQGYGGGLLAVAKNYGVPV
ncbi:MAG: TerD family protein [Deltaproteobacteria bacterium]|jgi:tellurium resistance protein TerD|nr:TerD family protein [Deltaproteobacteria bacterium]